MAKDFVHEKDAARYVMNLDGTLVSFNHTYTQPAHRGKGYAAEIVKFAVDDVEKSSGLRVLPMCWYVAEWFEANPERAGLLSR